MPLKPKEIRQMSPEEILAKIRQIRKEIVELRMRAARAPLSNPKQIRNLRKDLARLLTIYQEKTGRKI